MHVMDTLRKPRVTSVPGSPAGLPPTALPGPAPRGRGATHNPKIRFETRHADPFDDGWDTLAAAAENPPPLATELIRDASRSAISWNDSPDLGFDRAVNPYRGCEHGCGYCYARPSHAYLGYSPGLDFESKLVFKPDIVALLERELRKPGYVARPITLGSNTDPYQPIERQLKLTSGILELLERLAHPVAIVTKSAGVLRDLDRLRAMAARGLVRVHLSLTTLDPRLARVMEPRAASPARRLAAIAELSRAGIPTGVLAAPMIPGLNDAELERILATAAAAGARHAGYVLLRLPHELRALFEAWLATHFPDRARHVLSLIRETRAGALNDAEFHRRFSGSGPYASLLAQRFTRALHKHGFTTARASLNCTLFSPPPNAHQARQLALDF